MPIRFRCAYCNQLMAIARRKAGTVVRCPKCAGEIIVPATEAAPAGSQSEPSNNPGFDDNKYDAYLEEPGHEASAGKTATQTAADPSAPDSHDSPIPQRSVRRRGLFLPMGMVITVIAVTGFLLVLMFALGYFVGNRWR